MSEDTITIEQALKERIEIVSSTVCLHVVDHKRNKNNGHIKTFMKSEAKEADSFRNGYVQALMNQTKQHNE